MIELDEHRVELTAYCYRMLGSGFEAEDAVQETLVRAWRHRERFDEGRSALRSWLYSIATNVCLDMLRSPQRRARAMDLAPAARPGTSLGRPLPEHTWVQPVPDSRILPANGDPAELAVLRESVRLAFVAALQNLPPRQRAVLILRDVLRWRADEVAALLDSTTASVNSALHRARATLAGADLGPPGGFDPLDERQRSLLDRYVAAFERHDVETLVAVLHEDATMSMPPFTWWLRGREDLAAVLRAPGQPCENDRLLPAAANGCPAFGQYRDGHGFALVVLELRGERIANTTTFLDAPRLFPLFGLPMSFPEPARTT
ncbi:sigma-70 family RNA polymerase sigma factor [Prauserella flavalba]|uniref:RNA polymerase subunit sigma-70 n=1 Tax=Prauserella flavalba TaxID=1477506 RepID=A0A318MGI6_9PSEU|nr:sigma-70 family RNA polymerase sigma factor [Prauserella flavalba]PXY38260.1 RNA polymerase subunit sigma-70 [Prauserella flavalba]